jgi:predicted O-methyltransferase YrrM
VIINKTFEEIPLNQFVNCIKVDKYFMITQKDFDAICTLIERIHAEVIIEFGVQQGNTATAILDTFSYIREYIGIDVEKDYEPLCIFQKKEIPLDAGCFAKKDNRFRLIVKPRGTFDLTFRDMPVADFIFVDGDHSLQGIVHDTVLALATVKNDGIVCWHDYQNLSVVRETLKILSEKYCFNINIINDSNIAYSVVDFSNDKFKNLILSSNT